MDIRDLDQLIADYEKELGRCLEIRLRREGPRPGMWTAEVVLYERRGCGEQLDVLRECHPFSTAPRDNGCGQLVASVHQSCLRWTTSRYSWAWGAAARAATVEQTAE